MNRACLFLNLLILFTKHVNEINLLLADGRVKFTVEDEFEVTKICLVSDKTEYKMSNSTYDSQLVEMVRITIMF